MADQQIEDLAALAESPASGDLLVIVDVSDTTDDAGGTTKKITAANLSLGWAVPQLLAGGRLTLESGVPVSTSDQTAKTTVYYTPYIHDALGLYDGTVWNLRTFTETSVSLASRTADTNYDVFGYLNGGTFYIDLVAWTNDTTRASAVSRVNGVLVNTAQITTIVNSHTVAASQARLLGTIRTTGTTGQCEISATKCYVSNVANRVRHKMKKSEATSSWTYNSTTIRSLNNSTANRFEFVATVPEIMVDGTTSIHGTHVNANSGFNVGIGFDRTNGIDSDVGVQANTPSGGIIVGAVFSRLVRQSGIGYHYCQAVEASGDANQITLYGTSAGERQVGIVGVVEY